MTKEIILTQEEKNKMEKIEKILSGEGTCGNVRGHRRYSVAQ
ncbi:MAG: hypothetical protein PUI46_00600 [Lachnospiraceae bacterium]|nr:hypothetical protein [Lachnospiraceae bacterium]MDY5701206.1 hypothetical protein [Lachnospiraceae bacterium]